MIDSKYTSCPKLPRLPFGETNSVVRTDLEAFQNLIATVIPSLNKYEALNGEGSFCYKSSAVNINDMKVVASANTPAEIEIADNADITLKIPLHGKYTTQVGYRNYQWQARHSAIFLPFIARRGQDIEIGANLTINLSAERLQFVARCMLGASAEQSIDFEFGRERLLPLNTQHVSFDEIFRQLCGQVDTLLDQPEILALTGIDDMFYRNIILMLQPDLFFQTCKATNVKHSRRELDHVCEYILANLCSALTLSEIERISGLSTRKLQYGFLDRFGCTPMQWVRDQRLNMVHHLLKNSKEGDSVTSIATAYGFTNLGAFANRYQQRFQQFPSATLKNPLK